MPKEAKKSRVLDGFKYCPTEATEPILSVKELKERLGKDGEKEQWNTTRVVEDENGEKVLLITGYKTKEKDRSKRILKKAADVDAENIVSGTRRRKEINYKELTEKKSSRKSISKNTVESRSKTKVEKKRRTTKKSKKNEDDEDKENVDNQMIDEEEEVIEAPKKTRKTKQVKSTKKSTKKDEEKEEEEMKDEQPAWTLPLSQKVCESIQKLGAVLPIEHKKRQFRSQPIPESANYFCGVQWPKDVLYLIDPSLTNNEFAGHIEHQLFELSDTNIEWVNNNQDGLMIADGECIIACKLSEVDASDDFPVYVILEAVDDAPETVFKMQLSEYLASLSVDTRPKEE